MSRKEKNSLKKQYVKLSELHDRSFIIDKNTAFSIKEEYKTLRTNILLSLPTEGCKIIGITSAQPFEGKSVNCLNLAITFAQTGARVLLIDCDLRIPSQARLVGLKAAPGVSNVLVGMNNVGEAVQKTKYPGVDILLSGDIPPNPSELLGSENMEKTLRELSQKYEFIFIDLPPVNVVADAVIVSKYVSGLLLVVRSSVSRRDSIAEALKRLELARANIIGILLTCVKSRKLLTTRYKMFGKYR